MYENGIVKKNSIFVIQNSTEKWQKNQTLGEFIIENQHAFKYTSGELSSF